MAINQTAAENDGVVPEEAAYGVGSSMPGDEHVADGRVGARTVGAEADVVVVIVGLPPPPQPTRTRRPSQPFRGSCCALPPVRAILE